MMSRKELPLKFEEISEEERAGMKIRRPYQDQRKVRSTPGDILLPYAYASLANNFYNFEFRDDDVVVSTFPKSGTVWMGEIVWAMLNFDRIDTLETMHINSRNHFLDLDILNPPSGGDKSPLLDTFREKCPEGQIEDGIILQLAKADTGRRIIKSHLQLQLYDPNLLNNSKVVYVARNPKDACVSLYYFLSKRPGIIVDGDFSDFVENFMESQIIFAPYWAHLHQAWILRDHPNLHFVFFEDMKDDIMEELRKLNDFLNVKLTADQLKMVAEATSFDNMRSRDLKKPLTNMEGSFFRKGIVGDWKNMATPELDAKMDRWIEENSKNTGIKFRYT